MLSVLCFNMLILPNIFDNVSLLETIVLLKIVENRCRQTLVSYLDFGRADSLSLQLY